MKMAVRPVVFAAAVGMAALAGGALVAPADSALGRAGSAIGFGASPAEAALPLGAVGGGTIAPMLEQVTPAVVNISVLSQAPQAENPLLRDPFFRRFFNLPDQMPQSKPQVSAGSGVIVDARNGYVVTNNHVVENAQEIAVTLKDRRRLRAKLIGRDAATDIALLQIKAEGLTALTIGDSDRAKVGDFVVAIGNPFGLGQTVTSGIVSALGRSGLKIEGYEDFIQTDASINPGNSGGALVNFQGELIGINTAIIGPAGGSVGIGFAVPVSIVRSVMEQLREYGEVRRGRLGVAIQDLTPDLAESLSLKGDEGALIAKIERGSPADSGGLRSGDVVVAVDGRPIRSATDFRNRIGLLRVGTPVQLTVVREGGQKSVTVRTQR
ncbi:peptidase [Azospirillum sp. TSH100]|uniref:Do family serine endopeptidase n=1 Tax=Azospirillum sp. TSH100 TaxID=652764 RepID=UPI000D614805|nr:Do family serine endopeptidase [Azospirillum sp. TSH100]PWC81524.1 peptidase [Azospirillum sp. TSH100]QCG86895.1 Do family serine endopeptidase [Azospirillum sp. TSH100]